MKKKSTITPKTFAYFIIESCTDTISDNLSLKISRSPSAVSSVVTTDG
jgi:hypothetical protein